MYKSEVHGKGGISAKCVAKSSSFVEGVPDLVTLELRYPRFIHSEIMTHRMFSRNASSSRAIPVKKMLEQVADSPAMPIHWGKNQPGMQAGEERTNLIGFDNKYTPLEWWKVASEEACNFAKDFEIGGYHKQIVNRLLEPFQFISVVVTATEWDNFFDLRLHPDAQPEIQELARCMKEAIDTATAEVILKPYRHLPYVPNTENIPATDGEFYDWDTAIKASVARCARVSYLNHDKTSPELEKDVKLHDMLLSAGHMSPFEHVAHPMEQPYHGPLRSKGITHMDSKGHMWSGNLRGWVQYRQEI